MGEVLYTTDTNWPAGGLNVVRDIPWLPPVPQYPHEWPDWEKRVLEYRLLVQQAAEADEGIRARELARCDLSAAYLANTYGLIYEARGEDQYTEAQVKLDDEDQIIHDIPSPDDLRSGIIPYVQYPFQVETFDWLNARLTSRGLGGDGIIVKCRDMGLSNTVVFWLAHKWLFRRPFQARLLSRRENLVDATGDPDSLFWKLDTFLMGLPGWLMASAAPGFSWTEHRLMMRLLNPATGNFISGESTQADAGRGGRATVIIYDEFAFMDKGEEIWSAGRGSTNHRIGITTPSIRKGMDVYNIVHGADGYEQPVVLAIPWDQHPLHDEAWFQEEQKRDAPQRFAQEVLLDWMAGTGEWVYPETHPYQSGHYPYVPHNGDLIVTLDDGFDDEFSLVVMQYQNDSGRLRVLTSYQNAHQPIDFYGYLLRGTLSDRFHYGQREQEFMRFLKDKGPALYYGDAHGASIEQVSGTSIFGHLASKFGINVNYYIGPDSGTRLTFAQRRLDLGKLLPFLDFDSTNGAKYVLDALKKHRFKDPGDGDHMRDYREPLHSKWSHTVSALEYFAVQFDLFKLTTNWGKGGIKYSGRRISEGRLVAQA